MTDPIDRDAMAHCAVSALQSFLDRSRLADEVTLPGTVCREIASEVQAMRARISELLIAGTMRERTASEGDMWRRMYDAKTAERDRMADTLRDISTASNLTQHIREENECNDPALLMQRHARSINYGPTRRERETP